MSAEILTVEREALVKLQLLAFFGEIRVKLEGKIKFRNKNRLFVLIFSQGIGSRGRSGCFCCQCSVVVYL